MMCVDEGWLTLEMCVSKGVFSAPSGRRLRREWLANDNAFAPKKAGSYMGRPRKMEKDAAYFLRNFVQMQPDAQLSELSDALYDLDFERFSVPYLCKALKRLNITYKVANCYATARSDLKRMQYRARMQRYLPEQLVFIDESGFDYRVCNRKRARATRGDLAYLRQPFQRGQRLSFMPACSLANGCFAYYTKTGSVNGEVFLHYLREVLLPCMQRYPLTNSVIVCDNASIHHVAGVQELVRSHGECRKLCGRPASPLR